MAIPRIYVLNKNGERVGEVLGYANVTIRQTFNAVGRLTMTLPRAMVWQIKRGYGYEVQMPSGALLSGLFFRLSTSPGSPDVQVQGIGALAMLAARVALPEPNGDFGAQAYDVRTGAVEEVVKGYVRDNASKDALIPERAWPFEVGAVRGDGKTVTGRARFHNLLGLAQALIAATGDEFRMTLAGNKFEVGAVRDLTGAPLFADWIPGTQWGYGWRAPLADYVYAGGQGEGTQRTIVETLYPPDVSAFWRAEAFFDYRNAPDAGELIQHAQAYLAQRGSKEGYQLLFSGGLRYGGLYREGDRVTVQVEGRSFDGRIEGVEIKYDQQTGWRETVGIGVEAGIELLDVLMQADVERRLSNLEVV